MHFTGRLETPEAAAANMPPPDGFSAQDEQLATTFAGMVGSLLEWQRLIDHHD